jgi:two-component system response regulator AtoC
MVERSNTEPRGSLGILATPTTLVHRADEDPSRAEAMHLLVLEACGLAVHHLPRSGSLTIGRAEDCDVRLRDPLASRHHAVLHAEPLAIEDRGSANGTLIGGNLISPGASGPVLVGQAITIGGSLLLVRRAEAVRAPREDSDGANANRVEAAGMVLGPDPAMKRLYQLIERIGPGRISVLILGETGAGKELVAETIHRASPRRDAAFVRINCAALSETLLESELFGHERGAFTGAVTAKPGLIEVASSGSVFLDEVGELSLALQAKLLRVIEAREVTRVGSLRPREVDVRFISATNRNLEQQIARGAFRLDLFFRLSGVSVGVPPLRERTCDILPLAETFVARLSDQLGLTLRPRLTKDTVNVLLTHRWPGNVRELRNAMERAVLLCSEGRIEPADLSLGYLDTTGQPAAAAAALADSELPPAAPTPVSRHPDGAEPRQRIVEALARCNGNQTRAARLLGMPRRTLVAKLPLYNIPRPRKTESV